MWNQTHEELADAIFALALVRQSSRHLRFLDVWTGRLVIMLGIVRGWTLIRDLRVDGTLDIDVVLADGVAFVWPVVMGWWYVEKTMGAVISI